MQLGLSHGATLSAAVLLTRNAHPAVLRIIHKQRKTSPLRIQAAHAAIRKGAVQKTLMTSPHSTHPGQLQRTL